jgi:hypothetical protein
VDLWAVGAIVAELLMLAPIFMGDSDLAQIGRVFQVCMYVYMYICMNACMNACMYVCVHVLSIYIC